MPVYTPNYSCDLHSHTKRSDGNDTYKEIIDTAVGLGLKVLAITDHDIVPEKSILDDGQTFTISEYAKKKNITVLTGIEISCDTDVDDVHIIGLGCDFDHPLFAELSASMKESKVYSYKKLAEVLCENNINVTWQMVLDNNGSPLAEDRVQRKHIFEAIARAGYTKDWAEAKLMVRDNPKFNVRREKIAAAKAIELIHTTGGIAILAHPFLIDDTVLLNGKDISREQYIEHLIQNGLDGIEAAYTYNKTSYKGSLSPEEIEKIVLEKYSSRLKIISGGSDYHNDMKKGLSFERARHLGEKGITLEAFKANKYLSSLIDNN